MANPTDPNDPTYSQDSRYTFVNGRWQFRDPNSPGAQTGAKDPLTGTRIYGTSYDPSAVPGSAANPTVAGADVTGAKLNTGEQEAQRLGMAPWLAQLYGQSTTGGGAWEDALKRGTLAAQNAAMAVGQSTPGVGYQTALRNIQNAQSAAGQRGVGQANILRAQQQQQATQELGGALQAQGAQDIQQATDTAAAAQAARETQAAQEAATQKRNINTISGIGQGILKMFMSNGGKVPGEPEVFGDDSRNDTVPAMLSPKEIVLPLHVTQAPDAPERAAAFVRSIQGKAHPSSHFDDGGNVGSPYPNQSPLDWAQQQAKVTLGGPSQQAPSIESGSLLDTANFDANRKAVAQNQAQLGQMASGRGPSTAPQELQNATDANIAAAMQAAAGARGSVPMQSGALASETAAAEQGAAGKSAATTAAEQTQGQQALIQSYLRQRDQEAALARAKQQAAWRNTMMNMGIGLEQQQILSNMLTGGAQGLAAYSGASEGSSGGRGGYDATGGKIDAAFNAAGGGEVPDDESRRANAFLRALGRAA